MDTWLRLLWGLAWIIVGVVWITKREVPIGIEGRPPSFFRRGGWAVGLGIVALVLGLVVMLGIGM